MRWLLTKKPFLSRVCGVQASSADRGRMLPCFMPMWGENVSHSRHMHWQFRKISVEFVSVKWGFCQEFFSCCWHGVGVRIKPHKWLWFCLGITFSQTLQKRLTICSCLNVHQQTSTCNSVLRTFRSHSLFLMFCCDHTWLVYYAWCLEHHKHVKHYLTSNQHAVPLQIFLPEFHLISLCF